MWSITSPPLLAWLILDEGDNELRHFFAYLVAALQQCEPSFGLEIQAHLDAPVLPPL